MNINSDPAPAKLKGEGCHYLGLKEDPGTALAYASVWNYCHHAKPPAAVNLEHQSQFCQTVNYSQCPVFQNANMRALPRALRGRLVSSNQASTRSRWMIPILILLLIGVSVSWYFGFGPGRARTNFISGWLLKTSSAFNFPMANATPKPQGYGLVQTAVLTPTYTVTPSEANSLQPSMAVPSVGLPTIQIATHSVTGLCGYRIDNPIGGDPKLMIHQVGRGESLNMYALQYKTTVDAIVAVNYKLPIPVQAGWIIVIPLGTTNVQDIPPLKPHLASQADGSILTMAQTYSVDLQDLERVNGLNETCVAFAGWVLIPRGTPPPTP